MKIQSIQSNQTFTSTPHFISKEARSDLADVLVKLNQGIKTRVNKQIFNSEITNTLSIDKEAVLYDKRYYMVPVPPQKQIVGHTELLLENKSGHINVVINNQTGEIERCNKPFFTRWKKVLQKTENVLKTFKEEYDNSQKVRKHKISASGLIRDGIKSIYNV